MRFTKNIHMKLRRVVAFIRKLRFESSVISYGCQTISPPTSAREAFESSVISYGCQTYKVWQKILVGFESSVISYGCQTVLYSWISTDDV